jgi:histone deacetylase 1/2
MLGEEIKDDLPYNDYFEYFGPDYRLHLPVSNMENLNSPEYLEKTKIQLFEILGEIESVPGVPIQTGQVQSQLNPRSISMEVDEPDIEEELNDKHPDRRITNQDLGQKEHGMEME